ncbi:MAG: hypothetical protein JXB36_18710 [Gammaproteobacteria bacterium]|nr:hypothetical protein [Gammaproteobacteria bacterium]
MKTVIAILATVLAAAGAWAQQDRSESSPFTRQEAELISAVWPQIRSAASFEQIDWETVGLEEAPGNSEARRLMSTHWGTLRQAGSFADIDWEATTGYREPPLSRFALGEEAASGDNPFTEQESQLMAAVWQDIRNASRYEEIDWEEAGLSRAPGSRDAQRVMEDNWDTLRRAARFEDIDWEATTDYRGESRSPFSRDERSAFSRDGYSRESGPFTRQEAELMSAVWPEIRQARSFEQIDWERVGVEYAPGDAEARRVMAENWDTLRQAAQFSDIDWEATTGYRSYRDR